MKRFMSSEFANKYREWGWSGLGRSVAEGLGGNIGLARTPKGAWQWMGGIGTKRALRGLAGMAGLGAAVYMATDNPLLGMGAGVLGGGLASGGMKGMLGRGMSFMGPAFIGMGFMQGGIKGALEEGAVFAGIHVGQKALGVAFKGTAIHGFASGAMRFALNPAVLGLAAIGVGAYKGAKALAKLGRKSRESEFVGSMDAFNTQAAYTMRQRALQEINRSHTNARTILGNEASYMHLR